MFKLVHVNSQDASSFLKELYKIFEDMEERYHVVINQTLTDDYLSKLIGFFKKQETIFLNILLTIERICLFLFGLFNNVKSIEDKNEKINS